MYKKIPGNNNYSISLNCEIIKKKDTIDDIFIDNGNVTITLYGVVKTVNLKWLSLISHYEVNLREDKDDSLVRFEDCPTDMKSAGFMMVMKTPVYYKVGFRFIPSFTRYAINRTGTVIDTLTGNELNRRVNKYPVVSLYDPDRNRHRDVVLHRLVAFTWITCPSYFTHRYVNHINGDKLDFRVANLEWCTAQENSEHAVKTGLISKVINCKVRDVFTGEIITCCSIEEAFKYIGMSRTNGGKRHMRKNRLYNNRFELRRSDDDTPWNYDITNNHAGNSRYDIAITMPDGASFKSNNVTDLQRKLKVWNLRSTSITAITEAAKAKYPGIKIDIVDFYDSREVEAYNIITKTKHTAKNLSDLSKLIGYSRQSVRYASVSPGYLLGSWLIRRKSGEDWNVDEIISNINPCKVISVFNTFNGDELSFDSIRAVARYFSVGRGVVRHRLLTGQLLHGWKIKEEIVNALHGSDAVTVSL